MKELDLTQGSVPKVLLRFAMPFLIANVLQALYGGADLFVVGQYDDAASVAGVAIGSQVMQTITGIILGLTTGTTILIAMGTGAKDDRKVAATIGTSVYFFTVTGIILTLVMVLFHRPIAALMHTPEEAMADTLHYILICSAGIPFIMGYNVVCGILRGLGDSKSGRIRDACSRSRHRHGALARHQFPYRAVVSSPPGIPFRVYPPRHPFPQRPLTAHRYARRTHRPSRCAYQRIVSDNHRWVSSLRLRWAW